MLVAHLVSCLRVMLAFSGSCNGVDSDASLSLPFRTRAAADSLRGCQSRAKDMSRTLGSTTHISWLDG